MKALFPLSSSLLTLLTLLTLGKTFAAGPVDVYKEDFESMVDPPEYQFVSGGATSGVTIVSDPQPGGTRGKVVALDVGVGGMGGTAMFRNFSALDSRPLRKNIVELAATPGVDGYVFTFDIYIPTTTTLAENDVISPIVRWTDATETGKAEHGFGSRKPTTLDNFPRDTWVTVTNTGNPTVAGTFTVGSTTVNVTHAHPIVSINDLNDDAVEGLALYIDNVRLTINTTANEPNIVPPTANPLGIVKGAGPFPVSIPVTNNGRLLTLNVSSGVIEGTAADKPSYTIVTPFPLTVAPGETKNIDITFSPPTLRSYAASLTLTTNDSDSTSLSIPLNAIVIPDPYLSEEFILNGGFESGNGLGWAAAGVTPPASMEQKHTGEFSFKQGINPSMLFHGISLSQPSPPMLATDRRYIPITPANHGREFTYSSWYFNPSASGLSGSDVVIFEVRWNGRIDETRRFFNVAASALGTDQWFERKLVDVIPATVGGGDPVVSAELVFAIQDVGGDSTADQHVFIDDLSFKIDTSVFTITKIENIAGDIKLEWPTTIGTKYQVQRWNGTDAEWTSVGPIITADAATGTYTDEDLTPAANPRMFYRVQRLL